MTAVPITSNSNHASVTRLAGFSIREAAGIAAVATVRLRTAAVGGTILVELELAANESATISFANFLVSTGGVYVEVVAGTIEGSLYVG